MQQYNNTTIQCNEMQCNEMQQYNNAKTQCCNADQCNKLQRDVTIYLKDQNIIENAKMHVMQQHNLHCHRWVSLIGETVSDQVSTAGRCEDFPKIEPALIDDPPYKQYSA